jgi:hypothetical protein
MQQLGADGIGKLPITGGSGKVVPETAGPEVRAVNAHGFGEGAGGGGDS